MGVIGLTTFVDNHPELLTDHRLHDTRVLIDGNNLYYFLYYRYFDINIRYGGDYDCYADSVRYYFNTLKACNITPYVIFDGGYDMEEKKLKTTIKRQHSRLKNVTSLAKGQKGQVFPLLANEVFKQVLNEMGVCHMTCDFEADDQLAALAKGWSCPIMSNDSDFFIFDLPEGFIIFDYLNLEIKHCDGGKDSTCPEGYAYLSVQLYTMDNMIKSYAGLQRNLLPVFATLIGNDYVDLKDFEIFFTRVKLPKIGSARNQMQQRQQRMAGLLTWLASQDSLEHTISYIINCFPEGKRKRARALLDSSVKSYTNISSHLDNYFDSDDCRFQNRTKLQTFGGNSVPYWIVSGLRSAEIPVFIINTLTLHRNMLLPQVELVTEPCSFACSQHLRMVIYSILLTLDTKLNDRHAARKERHQKETVIQEYHRSVNDLICDRIEPIRELPGGAAIPYLQKIPHMSADEREALFWVTVGISKNSFMDLPNGLHIVFAAMCYWIKHATPKVSAYYVYALVACLIRLMLLRDLPQENTESADSKKSVPQSDGTVNCNKPQENVSAVENFEMARNNKFEVATGTDDAHCGHEGKVDVYTVTSQENMYDVINTLLEAHPVGERRVAAENTDRFMMQTTHNSTDNRFHTLITHNFSQFQTCLLSVMHLNMLLLQPLCNCYPALVFNGTFLYNLCVVLQRRNQQKTYICEQFGVNSSLSKLYLDIVDAVLRVVPEEVLVDSSSGAKKKNKQKKKHKDKARHVEDSDERVDETGSKTNEALQANCTLANRFMGLCLDDE